MTLFFLLLLLPVLVAPALALMSVVNILFLLLLRLLGLDHSLFARVLFQDCRNLGCLLA